ncbi:MAG: hypothetical protein ACE5OY_02945 [Candidatus Bathyarchaeia archaeon]
MFREKGYTESHQVLLDMGKIEDRTGLIFQETATRLERANIIIDSIGRLGTQEMTRYGMRECDMETIADLISRLVAGEDPRLVKREVLNFRSNFLEVKFTFG